jgi:serine/threonine protein kinase
MDRSHLMGAAAIVPPPKFPYQVPEDPKSIHNNYSVIYQIGQGGFSDVFLATDKRNNVKVAMKRISMASVLIRGLGALTNELQVYQRIETHQNIVSLQCAYRFKNHFYFVMDGLLGGDLRQYSYRNGNLSQRAISYVIACVGSGLHHMHLRGVFHRDVKPDNIVLDSRGTPYLTDFGISHLAKDSAPSSLVCCHSSGTLPYLAPELLTVTHEHSYQSDFWSLGVMAYELLFKRRPFHPHVPMSFISFVANQYPHLWDQQHKGIPCAPSISEDPTSHRSSITFNEDGTVPSSLIVSIPANRCTAGDQREEVNAAMMGLVKGLLDVRITTRLGQVDQFDEFTHHSAFIHFGYHHPHFLISASPLMEEDQSGVLSGEPPKRSFDQIHDDSSVPPSIDKSIEAELDKLFYVRGDKYKSESDSLISTQIFSRFSQSSNAQDSLSPTGPSVHLPLFERHGQ